MKSLFVLLIALAVMICDTGCAKRPDATLGHVVVSGRNEITVYTKYGHDHAKLGLKVTSPSKAPLFFLVRFSSYDGFPPSSLRILYSKTKDAVWLIGKEGEREDFISYLSLVNKDYIDKYGKLLRASPEADLEYPKYQAGELPPVPDDAMEVLAVKYGR